MRFKTNEIKLGLVKFTVSKLNNQRMIFGGDGTDGGATTRPTSQKTRPTKKE